MSILNSNNPMMKEAYFNGSLSNTSSTHESSMTIKGTLQKFGILTLLMFGTAIYAWKYAEAGNNFLPLILVAVFGNLALGFGMRFKPNWSTFLAPAGALLEGLFVGVISALYENKLGMSGGYSGIVPMAIGLTLGVAVALYLLYSFRIINVTQRFKSIVLIATAGIGIFYLVIFLLSLFMGNSAIPGFIYQPSLLGIGFSLLMVVLASMKLLVDFNTVEEAAAAGSPKYMEWYSGYALLVTIVWLYIEMLRLLAKLSSRD